MCRECPGWRMSGSEEKACGAPLDGAPDRACRRCACRLLLHQDAGILGRAGVPFATSVEACLTPIAEPTRRAACCAMLASCTARPADRLHSASAARPSDHPTIHHRIPPSGTAGLKVGRAVHRRRPGHCRGTDQMGEAMTRGARSKDLENRSRGYTLGLPDAHDERPGSRVAPVEQAHPAHDRHRTGRLAAMD